ncbi:4042_t:CDS:2, partial [Acaulospora morrowiae]
QFLKKRARKRFKEYKDETDEVRIARKIIEAKQALYRLKRANVFDLKAVTRVLEWTYGRKGQMRHKMLESIINEPSPAPKPIVRGFPRTAPPRMSPSLKTLLVSQGKSLYPVLPVPKHKPLYPSRRANLLWRHYSKNMKSIMPPINDKLLDEIEKKAGKGTLTSEGVGWRESIPSNTEYNIDGKKFLTLPPNTGAPKHSRDRVKEGPYKTSNPHNPRPRFIRRIYQRLLTDIPILKEKKIESESSTVLGSQIPKNLENVEKKSSMDQKHYIITKSPWSRGRPVPLVNPKDRQGLNVEEIKNFLERKSKKRSSLESKFQCDFWSLQSLKKTSIVNPTHDHIRDINFELLKSKGIQVLAFDKDNTLTAPYIDKLHEPFEAAWEECKKQFGKENIVIISNSVGTADDPGYKNRMSGQARSVEESLGVPVLRHKSKKPDGGPELIAHFVSIPPTKIAIIGDRLLTDVLFGNMNG